MAAPWRLLLVDDDAMIVELLTLRLKSQQNQLLSRILDSTHNWEKMRKWRK